MNFDTSFPYDMLSFANMEYFDRFETSTGLRGFRVISPSHAIFTSKKCHPIRGDFLFHIIMRQPAYNFNFCTVTEPIHLVVYQNEERYFIGKITFTEYQVFRRRIAREWHEYCLKFHGDNDFQVCWQQEGF